MAAKWVRGWLCWILALLPSLTGCSGSLPEPSQPEEARRVLTIALDAWKAGKTSDSLRAGQPPILVIDRDWSGGSKLAGYEFSGEGAALGLNIQQAVDLTLTEPTGRTRTKRVSYSVATGSNPVVARQDVDF